MHRTAAEIGSRGDQHHAKRWLREPGGSKLMLPTEEASAHRWDTVFGLLVVLGAIFVCCFDW